MGLGFVGLAEWLGIWTLWLIPGTAVAGYAVRRRLTRDRKNNPTRRNTTRTPRSPAAKAARGRGTGRASRSRSGVNTSGGAGKRSRPGKTAAGRGVNTGRAGRDRSRSGVNTPALGGRRARAGAASGGRGRVSRARTRAALNMAAPGLNATRRARARVHRRRLLAPLPRGWRRPIAIAGRIALAAGYGAYWATRGTWAGMYWATYGAGRGLYHAGRGTAWFAVKSRDAFVFVAASPILVALRAVPWRRLAHTRAGRLATAVSAAAAATWAAIASLLARAAAGMLRRAGRITRWIGRRAKTAAQRGARGPWRAIALHLLSKLDRPERPHVVVDGEVLDVTPVDIDTNPGPTVRMTPFTTAPPHHAAPTIGVTHDMHHAFTEAKTALEQIHFDDKTPLLEFDSIVRSAPALIEAMADVLGRLATLSAEDMPATVVQTFAEIAEHYEGARAALGSFADNLTPLVDKLRVELADQFELIESGHHNAGAMDVAANLDHV